MILTLSKAKQGKEKLAPNFWVYEFACKDGSDTILVDTVLVYYLQKIRDHFNASVTINSAYRTVSWNKAQGGKSSSYHLKGKAADIVVAGHTTQEVYDYCVNVLKLNGVGRYYNGRKTKDQFVHIDVGSRAVPWRQIA